MGEEREIKFEGLPEMVEFRPDLGADDETIGFCFKKVDQATFKSAVSSEVLAILLDAVRLVRCKQCIHAPYAGEEPYGMEVRFPDDFCPFNCADPWYNVRPDPEFFCSRGERKEGPGCTSSD